MAQISYKVLLAKESSDDFDEKGVIGKEAAVDIFLKFPFRAEIEKRNVNPLLTPPTLTFSNQSAEELELAIWSETEHEYSVWFQSSLLPVDHVKEKQDVVKCIEFFFDEKQEELGKWIEQLISKYQ